MKKRRTQSFHFWSTNDPFSPWRLPKWKKIRSSGEKLQLLGYANMSKSRLYLLSFFPEKHDYFLPYLGNFAKKQTSVTNQRVRIKI